MENGTVQGYGWPALGWVNSRVEVTQYRVETGFYNAALHTLVNLGKWNGLSKAQQDLLTEVGLKYESRSESDNPVFQAAPKNKTSGSPARD